MASRMRSTWSRGLTALIAGASASPALAASLGAHALLAAAVTLVPARSAAPAPHEVELAAVELAAVELTAVELVPQLLPAELLPAQPSSPAVPGERAVDARADALDREGPPLQKLARPRNVAKPSVAAAAAVPSSAVPVPAPTIPMAPAPTVKVSDADSPPSVVSPPSASSPQRSRIEAPRGEPVYGEGDVDRAPRLLTAPRPAYPAQALRQGHEGDVVLTLVVDAAGRVEEANVTRGAGRGFDEAALAAARGLRFHPGSKAGRNVPVRVKWTCRFRLE